MIAVGCDHAAYDFKMQILEFLKSKGYETLDVGSDGVTRSEYPEYAELVCKAIQEGRAEKGLLFCGTGIGMSISANKCKGIRAAVCTEALGAELSRRHNDANVLCMGARMTGIELAKHILEAWLNAEFEGGRHQGRVDLISQIEERESGA